jgi:hypothetical protein
VQVEVTDHNPFVLDGDRHGEPMGILEVRREGLFVVRCRVIQSYTSGSLR